MKYNGALRAKVAHAIQAERLHGTMQRRRALDKAARREALLIKATGALTIGLGLAALAFAIITFIQATRT